MPNTAKGFPFPAASDPVAQGAAAMQALAEAADARSPAVGSALPTALYTGQAATLRLGADPAFQHVGLIYDAALGKWYTPVVQRPLWTTANNVGTSDELTITEKGSPLLDPIPYKIYTDAGLTLQTRLTLTMDTGTSKFYYVQLGIYTQNLADAAMGSVVWQAANQIATPKVAGAAMFSTGWFAPTGITVKDFWHPTLGWYREAGGTGINTNLRRPSIEYRWVK